MLWLKPHRPRVVMLAAALMLACAFPANATNHDKEKDKPIPAVRWDEDHPGCTFSRTDDGKFRYGLWAGDVGITVAIDSQELEKVHRRHEPFFGVLVNVRYRGQEQLDLAAEKASLEFVTHFHTVQPALDPDDFAQKIQNDADELDHETAREVQKHPEKKDEKEAYVRAFQKDSAQLIEFVTKSSLRPAHLGPGNPETSGWVLFNTSSQWIGSWKRQEQLILRLPLEGRIFEFPFTLPPKPGEAMLRKRD